jgi:hypothetical protein
VYVRDALKRRAYQRVVSGAIAGRVPQCWDGLRRPGHNALEICTGVGSYMDLFPRGPEIDEDERLRRIAAVLAVP